MKSNNVAPHIFLVILLVGIVILTVFSSDTGFKEKLNDTFSKTSDDDKLLKNFDWESYYGGGFGIDNTLSLDGESVRISTGVDGGWYGAKADFESVDLTDGTVSFSFRVHDWNDLDKLVVILASDNALKNYFAINLKNYFARPVSGEWIDVALEPATFIKVEGEPDLADIRSVALRAAPKPDVFTRVWFDKFDFIPKKSNRKGVVTHTFDDGLATVADAKKVMSEYGYQGTAFIIPETIGEEGFLQPDEITDLSNSGWDISGHGGNNLVEMSPVEVDTHLAQTYLFLRNNNYSGFEHYAYPNGMYNESVESQVMEYFSSARTIDGFSQPVNKITPSHVNALTVSSSTPIKEIVSEVNKAVDNGSWLILVWHNFTQSPDKDTDYRLDDFMFLLDYLHKNEVEVMKYSEAYKLFSKEQ